ncbi:MAG: NAD(P)-binding oxidoreductase [Verrucomicrobiota bacterium]
MKILVVGATGQTGRLLVEQLLLRGKEVLAVIREKDRIPEKLRRHENLQLIEGSVLSFSDEQLAPLANGCDAVASCLGHNLSFRGIFGQPRRLVTDTLKRLATAIEAKEPDPPIKFVLMNTTGNRNRDLNEPVSLAQKFIVTLIRLLLPPHADNEDAADYLRTEIGQESKVIRWVVVRPDGLIHENEISEFETHPSPTRSAIFNPGKTSRINVACFMADLLTNPDNWAKWEGRMPVLYNGDQKS